VTAGDLPRVLVGEMQGRHVTFAAHPRSKGRRVDPHVPSVTIESDHDPPFDFEDGFWAPKVEIVVKMLGFADGAALVRPLLGES
jgi:hypothetical protein